MRKVLSIDNKTEDIPQVLRATCRLKGKPAAFVLRPQDGQVVLVVFDTDRAKVWQSSDGTLPSGTPSTLSRTEALALVKRLSRRSGKPSGASLRGRWKGEARLDSRGLPQIELTRRVGQATVTLRSADLPCRPYLVTVSVAGTWKGGPSKRKPRQVPASGNQLQAAFELARKEVRTALRTLHGESDRRQAHDSGYAKRKPIKWSGTPRDPLAAFDPKPPKGKKTRKKAKATTSKTAAKKAGASKPKASTSSRKTPPAKTSRAPKTSRKTAPAKTSRTSKASKTSRKTKAKAAKPAATRTTSSPATKSQDEQLALLFANAIRTAVQQARTP